MDAALVGRRVGVKVTGDGACLGRGGCSKVRDIFGNRMTRTDAGDTDVGCFTGFAQSVVT